MAETVVFVHGKGKINFLTGAKLRTFTGEKRVQKADDFLEKITSDGAIFLSPMGGPAQELAVRARDEFGLEVQRIPWYRLQEIVPVVATGASDEDIARAINLAWRTRPEVFYRMDRISGDMAMLRLLTRVRKTIQDVFRKPAQLQFYSSLRSLRYLLPRSAEDLVEHITKAAKEKWSKKATDEEIRAGLALLKEAVKSHPIRFAYELTEFYANPKFVRAALGDEVTLEGMIMDLAEDLEIWEFLHPGKKSVLPALKGFGPALGGAIISEIGDIRRFPHPNHLRSYARYGLKQDGEGRWVFPRRITGRVSAWNEHLSQAVWNWSTGQVPRYESVWRDYYYWAKATEMQAHPEVVETVTKNRFGEEVTVYLYTLKHLDSRAKRKTGSLALEYLFGLWRARDRGVDPERWYPNSRIPAGPDVVVSWPQYFAQKYAQLYDGGMLEYMKAEIERRRRVEPEEDEEEEE